MSDADPREQLLAVFRGIAAMVPIALATEANFTKLASKIDQKVWDEAFKRFPRWYDFYFLSGDDAVERLFALGSGQELLEDLDADSGSLDGLLGVLAKGPQLNREIGEAVSELEGFDGQAHPDLNDPENLAALEELAVFKAFAGETRARCFFGQSMHSLIQAGRNGNNAGFERAVQLDPTLQWHPELAQRVANEGLRGKTAFALMLSKAAAKGPSKNIDKDLHQLRYVLGILRELGILNMMEDADRYRLFCQELGLYPDNGKDPKAGLCTMIKRWEKSLVL